MEEIKEYQKLAKIFKSHGFNLYLVGGTVRDYLLNKTLTDMDATSDATPSDILAFLEHIDNSFAHLGSLKYKNENGLKFDITTLRKESNYLDSRHPSKIEFVKHIKEDYLRRDFTINALYLDESLNVIDYCHGQEDLNNRILRMIGEPNQRLKEDPLRILRAIRFAITFDLTIEETLFKAMQDHFSLLKKITDAKLKSEINKIDLNINKEKKEQLFKQFDIANLQGVIK